MSNVSAAVRNATEGFRVFPLRPNGDAKNRKRPMIENWQERATNDAFAVLETWPGERCAPGISTDGLVVLDADVGKGGLEAITKLFGGTLPATRIVRTGGGGLHVYFKAPPGSSFSSRACIQRKDGATFDAVPGFYGIDVRAQGGLVVAPGAEIDGRSYTLENAAPIADLPPFIAELLKPAAPKSLQAGQTLGPLDAPYSIECAVRYLTDHAPTALEGSGGDQQTYDVACRVLDFAIDPETCLELMAEHWNPRCEPPWDYDELTRKVANAVEYRRNPIGNDAPGLCFAPVQHPPGGAPNALAGRIRLYAGTEASEKAIPPRPWIVPKKLIREAFTVMGAPGSAGKSLYNLQIATAIAIAGEYPDKAKELIGVPVRESCNVLVINNEDPDDELDRRLAAVMRAFQIDRQAVHGRIHLMSGAKKKFKLAIEDAKGNVEAGPELPLIIEYIKENDIGAVIFDPLLSIHNSDESSNTKMQRVVETLTAIAADLRIAVLVSHHTTKPPMAGTDSFAGNVNAIRGASAVKDGSRISLTLFGMGVKDGDRLGIPKEHRHRYVRLDDAKANLHLASPFAEWFFKESVQVGEDSMGVLRPVQLKEATADDHALLIEVLTPALEGVTALSLKAAIMHLKATDFFKEISEPGIRERISAAFINGADIKGRTYNFTPNGLRGGKIHTSPETP